MLLFDAPFYPLSLWERGRVRVLQRL